MPKIGATPLALLALAGLPLVADAARKGTSG